MPAFYLVEKNRGRAAWHAYEAEARQRGVKVEFSDYWPPNVPDPENFAAIPVFDAAFAAQEAGKEVPNPFTLPSDKGAKPPKLADPTLQHRIDLVAWQKFFVDTGLLASVGDNAARDVLKALESYAEPLAQLQAAGARPHCQFPVKWEKGFAAALPHLQLLQNASKLYALRVAAHLALGESSAAYEAFRTGLRLSTATQREPTLIAGLVRIAMTVTLVNAVWDGLAGRQWAEPELRRIEADLAGIDWLSDLLFAMGSERGAFNYMADMLNANRRTFSEIMLLTEQTKTTGCVRNWGYWLYPSGWLYQSKVRSNRFFDEMATRIDPKQRRFYGERAVLSSPANITDMPTKIRYMIFAIAAPAMETVEKRYLQMTAVTDQTRLACALERYRLGHGAYPDALVALARDFAGVLPHEVVSGEPYRYRRGEDGTFLLYSVGADGRDDGGTIDPKLSASKQRDWVWRYPPN